MNRDIEFLKGSPHRDECKFMHKRLGSPYYCLDMDLLFVEKYPPGIAAGIDYKKPGEVLTFAEVIAYNDFRANLAPMYICHTEDPKSWQFVIYEYIGGDFRPAPPIAELRLAAIITTKRQWQEWEDAVRQAYRIQKKSKVRNQLTLAAFGR